MKVLLKSILLWKGNKIKGCRSSPGVRISAVTVVSGTVARLFHCGVGTCNSNSLRRVAKETEQLLLFHLCRGMSEYTLPLPRFTNANFRTLSTRYFSIERHYITLHQSLTDKELKHAYNFVIHQLSSLWPLPSPRLPYANTWEH